MEIKDHNIESCGSSNQQHSEADTDEVDGDDEEDERASDKMDVSHATNDATDVKPPKIKRVNYIEL